MEVMLKDTILENPHIQYGFAFVCLVLICVLVWVLKNVFRLFEKNAVVIADNTSSNTELRDCLAESREEGRERAAIVHKQSRTLEALVVQLENRPCLFNACNVEEAHDKLRVDNDKTEKQDT